MKKINSFVANWNRKFPFDFWWRKKYNVPFGSAEHKAMSFWHMKVEYEEEQMFNEQVNKKKLEIENKENEALGIKLADGVKMDKKDVDSLYESPEDIDYFDSEKDKISL